MHSSVAEATATTGVVVGHLLAMFALLSALSVAAAVVVPTEGGQGVPPKVSGDVRRIQSVQEGTRSFRLDCPVDAEPPPLFEWLKDGEGIGVSWTRFRALNDGRVLRIRNVNADDAGQYECVAVNGFGRRVVQFRLFVYGDGTPDPLGLIDYSGEDSDASDRKPIWTNPMEIQQMTGAPIMKRIGSNLVLRCQAVGDPRPEIQWLKDGRVLSADSAARTNRWSLQLRRLSTRNSGRYTCRVFNKFGVINATFDIRVSDAASEPPQFDAHPLNSSVNEGQTATLQCQVRSSVQPHIRWLKRIDDHTKLEDNSTLFSVGSLDFVVLNRYPSETQSHANGSYLNRLIMPQVAPRDSGVYICVVTNPAGHMVYRSAYLYVKPRIGQERIVDSLPTHLLIGIPVAILLLIVVAYAVYFLQRQQAAASHKPLAVVATYPSRPPPPARPPPSLPGKSPASLLRSPADQRYVLSRSSAPYCRTATTNSGGYNQYDAGARAPLFDAGSRDLYEPSPTPQDALWPGDDYDRRYPEGRLQPYPSMYSCR